MFNLIGEFSYALDTSASLHQEKRIEANNL